MAAPSSSATWNGTVISQTSVLTFGGSSSPVVSTVPRCIGALVRPSGDASRTITLNGVFTLGDQSKAEIELTQKNLGTFMGTTPNGTLVVHGNTYAGLIPQAISFEEVIHNEYMIYTITFEMPSDARALDSGILIPEEFEAGVRTGSFEYEYGNGNQSLSSFNFPILDNMDLTISTTYDLQTSPRAVRSEGGFKRTSGGTENLRASCWIAGSSVNQIESYFYNIICPVGALGKKGVLSLGGNSFDNTLLTSCSTDVYKGGDDEGVGGTSTRFTLDFIRGVC